MSKEQYDNPHYALRTAKKEEPRFDDNRTENIGKRIADAMRGAKKTMLQCLSFESPDPEAVSKITAICGRASSGLRSEPVTSPSQTSPILHNLYIQALFNKNHKHWIDARYPNTKYASFSIDDDYRQSVSWSLYEGKDGRTAIDDFIDLFGLTADPRVAATYTFPLGEEIVVIEDQEECNVIQEPKIHTLNGEMMCPCCNEHILKAKLELDQSLSRFGNIFDAGKDAPFTNLFKSHNFWSSSTSQQAAAIRQVLDAGHIDLVVPAAVALWIDESVIAKVRFKRYAEIRLLKPIHKVGNDYMTDHTPQRNDLGVKKLEEIFKLDGHITVAPKSQKFSVIRDLDAASKWSGKYTMVKDLVRVDPKMLTGSKGMVFYSLEAAINSYHAGEFNVIERFETVKGYSHLRSYLDLVNVYSPYTRKGILANLNVKPNMNVVHSGFDSGVVKFQMSHCLTCDHTIRAVWQFTDYVETDGEGLSSPFPYKSHIKIIPYTQDYVRYGLQREKPPQVIQHKHVLRSLDPLALKYSVQEIISQMEDDINEWLPEKLDGNGRKIVFKFSPGAVSNSLGGINKLPGGLSSAAIVWLEDTVNRLHLDFITELGADDIGAARIIQRRLTNPLRTIFSNAARLPRKDKHRKQKPKYIEPTYSVYDDSEIEVLTPHKSAGNKRIRYYGSQSPPGYQVYFGQETGLYDDLRDMPQAGNLQAVCSLGDLLNKLSKATTNPNTRFTFKARFAAIHQRRAQWDGSEEPIPVIGVRETFYDSRVWTVATCKVTLKQEMIGDAEAINEYVKQGHPEFKSSVIRREFANQGNALVIHAPLADLNELMRYISTVDNGNGVLGLSNVIPVYYTHKSMEKLRKNILNQLFAEKKATGRWPKERTVYVNVLKRERIYGKDVLTTDLRHIEPSKDRPSPLPANVIPFKEDDSKAWE